MFNASVRVHRMHGVWNSSGGFELPLVYAAGALALACTGPGAFPSMGWSAGTSTASPTAWAP